MIPEIQTILVPKGAEHQAICKGLRDVRKPPAVLPIPVGSKALAPHLKTLQATGCLNQGQRVLVMGLCGGLNPDLAVGMPVLYKSCTFLEAAQPSAPTITCDRTLTAQLQAHLTESPRLVTAVTSDRVIFLASEKQQLFQETQADVVDMEGYTILSLLTDLGISVVTLRVVSDDCQSDLPDLSNAFDSKGALRPLALTTAMIRRPIAASQLIRGSTKGLKIMETLTHSLFRTPNQ